MKRNYVVDFFRGIVTISIVLIHTAWWSGEYYLPPLISNLTLFLDVPAFMFIAGISFGYSNSIIKNIKNIINQWSKYLFFLIFYTLILIIFFNDNSFLTEILYWIGYYFPTYNDLCVVKGSIWFMPMYISVSILCSIIIISIKKHDNNNIEKNLKYIIVLLLIIFIYNQCKGQILFFDSQLTYYSIIFILGYYSSLKKLSKIDFIKYMFINIILTLIIFKLFNFNLNLLQYYKFPPTLPYLIASNFSILLIWYLKDIINVNKTNIIAKLGANAIFFYFAQGISSSILIKLVNIIIIKNIYIKLLVMFIINLVLALIIGISLTLLYNYITKIKKHIRKENKND